MLNNFGKNHGQKHSISEVLKLAKSLLVLPETNAICEWSFSAIKYIKIFLRNTMQLEIASRSQLVQLGRSSWGFHTWYSDKITIFWDVLEKRVIYIVVNGTTESWNIVQIIPFRGFQIFTPETWNLNTFISLLF